MHINTIPCRSRGWYAHTRARPHTHACACAILPCCWCTRTSAPNIHIRVYFISTRAMRGPRKTRAGGRRGGGGRRRSSARADRFAFSLSASANRKTRVCSKIARRLLPSSVSAGGERSRRAIERIDLRRVRTLKDYAGISNFGARLFFRKERTGKKNRNIRSSSRSMRPSFSLYFPSLSFSIRQLRVIRNREFLDGKFLHCAR